MSRVQLLYDLVQDFRTVADDVQAIADALMQTDDVPALPERKAIPQTTAAPADDKAGDEPTAPITKEQVRDVLKQLSRSGYRDAVQNLIKPPGKPTLVPKSDKRPEMNSNNIMEDFENE